MSGDVQHTLNELERRLRELQAELGTAQEPAAPPPPPPPAAPPPPPTRSPLQDQLDELLRFRDQLAAAADTLVEDYTRLVERLERVAQVPPTPGPTPAAGHLTFPVPPPSSPSSEGTIYSGEVTIEAAPFEEIGALAAFESALRSVTQAQDVHVRSFDGERAVIDVRLGGEVALVFELRRASDQGFDVSSADSGRLELSMHPAGELPFPMRP
jgi:hypothetical protein